MVAPIESSQKNLQMVYFKWADTISKTTGTHHVDTSMDPYLLRIEFESIKDYF